MATPGTYLSSILLNLAQTPGIDPSKDEELYDELVDIHNAIEQLAVAFTALQSTPQINPLAMRNLASKYGKRGGPISGDTWWLDGKFPIIDKASGNGIKVDSVSPTFGFADIIGDQFSKNTGATKPTLAAYNGAILAWQFGTGDEAYMSFHIPHDYVLGTDIHLHIHWSQTSATDTGGTIDFKYFAIYAKGHNQAAGSAFTAVPVTATFSSIDINDGASGLNQYQQFLTEVTISAASATAALFDRDDFEPDGVIELTFEMDANNLTGPGVTDPFVHFVDIHYQTTGLIGTKSRTPDFYT